MLISTEWLYEHMKDTDIKVLDCRYQLGNPLIGYKQYQENHLPFAQYLDLEKDLSGPVQTHGGRHPLPDAEQLADKLGKMGIDHSKKVVVYDEDGGAMATRAWWLLSFLGHEKVFILEGGIKKWQQKGYPLTQQIPQVAKPRIFTTHIRTNMIADREEVLKKLDAEQTLLIDSRELKRYQGLEEPIDAIAGHIPHAVHYFWQDVRNEDGTWKTAQELQQIFANIAKEKELIVYCGSGVTATPNILALHKAGFKNVKLYAGSWSDWISYANAPIAKIK